MTTTDPEPTAMRTRTVNGLDTKARLYIAGILLAGISVLAWSAGSGLPDDEFLLLLTCLVASIAQIYKVEGATERTSYNLSLVVYGFTLFTEGLAAASIVVIVACVAEWAWHRYPWFIQSFNIAALVLAAAAGGAVYSAALGVGDFASFDQLVAVLLGAGAFTLVNHLMVGLVIRFARGQSFAESGVFSRTTLVIDGTLLLIGGVTALMWEVNPFTSLLALAPLYLIHSTLHVPALQRQAATDAKTGLFNARYFTESLQKELDRADRFDRPLTVIMGDLDLLRNINNTYGHLAGDNVLVGVATIMKESVREYDVVARFGGEEFAILMPETTLEQALPRMEGIRKAIEAAEFDVPTSVVPIRTTMSFGVSTRTRVGLTAQQIVHEADLAVYRAKLSGRNRICLLDDDAVQGGEAAAAPPLAPLSSEADDLLSGRAHEPVNTVPVRPRPTAAYGDGPDTAPAAGTTFRPRPPWAITLYVWTTVLISVTALLMMPLQQPESLDYAGLATVTLVALLLELLTVEVYAKDTSVSTSAAPFIAGTLLFGPAGALCLSVVVGASAMIKHGSPPSRFAFNSGIHLLSGVVMLTAATAIPGDPASWSPGVQAAVALASALILYLMTTASVSGAIHLTTGEPLRRIYKDRFRRLAPYYLGLGLMAYAIIFSYLAAGPQGVLVVLVPLLLLRLGQKQYVDRTQGFVKQLRDTNAELRRRSDEVLELSEELLVVLSKTVDLRDPYTAGHSEQVSRYASLIAEELGLPPERVDLVRKAALLHDIGKLGIPEAVLRKAGRLTPQEYEHVKQHSAWGAHLLGESRAVHRLVPFLRHHHEHYDGSGYPDGLTGHDIPLEARILAVADAVDAMASDRSYRGALDPETVLRELLAHSGNQFDPAAVAAFHGVVERDGMDVIVNSARAVLSRVEHAAAGEARDREPLDRVVELYPLRRSAGS